MCIILVQSSKLELLCDIYIYICVSLNILCAGAVKDAIETLRSNGVKAFVLDLRNNR